VCDGTNCDGGTDGGSDGGCTWTCSYWAATDAGTAVRTCVDTNGCGTNRPSEGPVALPALDNNFYKCNVQPVLARSCAMAGCHGGLSEDRPLRVFARGRQRKPRDRPYTPSSYGAAPAPR